MSGHKGSIVYRGKPMRVLKTMSTAALLALFLAPHAAHSQLRRFPADPGTRRASTSTDGDVPADTRSLLGIAVGTSGTDRDTLGLLVTQVLRDGPGDRAGMDEGNRLAEIDGVSLRLDPADVGRSSATDAVMRRLTRTLHGMQSGEQATLRIFGAGKFRNVSVQLGSAAALPNATTAATPVPAPTPPPTILTLPSHAGGSSVASGGSDLATPRANLGTVD